MKFKLYVFITALILCNTGFAQDWKVFPYKPAGSVISFPADEGRHAAEPVEWWYTSGHLTGITSGKTYSFMISYFYYPALSFDGFRILNITDDATGAFYEETKPVIYTHISEGHLDIRAAVFMGEEEQWSNKSDTDMKLIPFEYTIKAASATAGLYLNCTSLKRPLILGDDGYLEQGLSNYTYYYSQTRNAVSGKLTINGITEEVTGISWIDRQYGNFNPYSGEKYEWFHMQLSNGMDVNLWNLFTTNNTIPENNKYRILSAYVNDATQYTSDEFKIERLGFNWMPDSAMCYSHKWRLTSDKNKIDVIITANHDNTEVQLPFRFFEGSTTISGTVNGNAVTGMGFAELLHSYENPKVIITNPDGGMYQNDDPVSWQLSNPDEGRPVTYHLEYSINNKASFIPIAQGITDTFYQWANPALSKGDKIWFKITARSIDGQLLGTAISAAPATVAEEHVDQQMIKLYPNPVENILFFAPAFQMNPPGKIMDANGRVIYLIKNNSISNKMDVDFLPKGVYFLSFGSADEQVSLKFIKE